jgi:hypothetical protein
MEEMFWKEPLFVSFPPKPTPIPLLLIASLFDAIFQATENLKK